MRKLFLSLLLLTGITFVAKANFKGDSSARYTEATISFEEGKTQRVYVWAYIFEPESFQTKFHYIDADQYEELKANGDKIKGKYLEKAKAKDIKQIELWNGEVFVNRKYADLSELGMGSIPKQYLIHQIVDGELSVYRLYTEQINIYSNTSEGMRMEIESSKRYINQHSNVLIAKGDDSPKSIKTIVVGELVADKESVYEKLESGAYGSIYQRFNSKLKSGDLNPSDYLQDFAHLARDYNKAD